MSAVAATPWPALVRIARGLSPLLLGLALLLPSFGVSPASAADSPAVGSSGPCIGIDPCVLPPPTGSFPVFGPRRYLRATAGPFVETATFSVLYPSAVYTLEIFNGGLQDGELERVSSAVIELNGVQVVGPRDFNQQVDHLTRTIEPGHSNELSVELRGRPGSGLVLRIFGLDLEPPTIVARVSPPANAAGWHNVSVTVSFECADAISGIAVCPASVVVSTEGAGQVVEGTAVDNAGNAATTSVTLNIDKTPPTIVASADPPPNANGWNNTDVTVSFACQDALSGVESCTAPQNVTTEGASQAVTGMAVDLAGNTASATATLSIDKTPPTIVASADPPPNANGWNNTDVTVSFGCQDALSGVESCTAPQTATAEGANQDLTGTAVDLAGNTASATATLRIDKTAPTIAFSSPVPVPGGSTERQPAFVTPYSDVLSGLDLPSYVLLVNILDVTASTAVGPASATYTPSSPLPLGENSGNASIGDLAGNTGTATVTFTLIDDDGGGGDPVQLPSGNFLYNLTHHDIRVLDDGLALELLFTYRSREPYEGPFGHRWHSTLTSAAIMDVAEGDQTYVTIREGSGERRRCRLGADGRFADRRLVYDRLLRNADGSYTLDLKDGRVHEYGADGALRTIAVPGRGAVAVGYDEAGRIRTAVSAGGHALSFSWGPDGRIAAVSDPMVGTYVLGYDPDGNLASATDPLGNVARYTYDGRHRMTSVVAPNGAPLLENAYDERSRVRTQVLPQGTIQFLYDAPSRIRLVDPRGTTTFVFHPSGLPETITYPDGRTTFRQWDDHLNLVRYTEDGHTTRLGYDAAGRLVRAADSSGRVFRFEYDPASDRLASVVDLGRQGSRTPVDPADKGVQPWITSDLPTGRVATIRYDDVRGLIEVTDVDGRTEVLPADAQGVLRTWRQALGSVFPFTSRYQLRP